MSLLSVKVKKAQFSGAQAAAHQWNTYVTLKLQHVKSTTVTVKGANPNWEQDFLFEVNSLDAGLLVEVWSKGLVWDKDLGYHWLHLRDIQHSNVEGIGQWLPLEAELVMRDGEVVGTKTATGHAILIDARFEIPYADLDGDGEDNVELQRKLEMLNSIMLDQDARPEQGRRQHQYYIQCVSEDSDYTSDYNLPVGQNPNSSASQFLSAANQLCTPQRSLNSSRENSYEKDDEFYRANGSNQISPYYHPQHPQFPPQQSHGGRKQLPSIPTTHRNANPNANVNHQGGGNGGYWDEQPRDAETDPLFYNSRPQSNYKSYGRYRNRGSWEDDDYNNVPKRQEYSTQYDEDYEDDAQEDYDKPSHTYSKRLKSNRRGNSVLERQYTLYDGTGNYAADEEVQDVNSKTNYPTDSYSSSSYNQNAQNDAVYDGYNQEEYSEYPNDTSYNEGYPNEGQAYDDYSKDSTSYGYDEWKDSNDTRDHYQAPTMSSNELPQIPNQNNRKSQLPSQASSPFASQSTVKEMSVAIPPTITTVHSVIPQIPHQQDFSATGYGVVDPKIGYGNVDEDTSFYDASNYTNHAQVGHPPVPDATVPTSMSTTTATASVDQYVDAYENQAGYEDWQNYGYYDEAGNFISYDQTGYYQDESGNLISNEVQPPQTAMAQAQDQEGYSSYYDQTAALQTTADQSSNYNQVPIAAAADPSAAILPQNQNQNQNLYNEQYDATQAPFYDATTEGNQNLEQYQEYDQTGTGVTAQSDTFGGSYDQDGYWYDAKEEMSFDAAGQSLDQSYADTTDFAKDPALSSLPNDEYNYAYQSSENLTAFDTPTHGKLNKTESRRSSFRKQVSTRSDHGFEPTPAVPVTQPTSFLSKFESNHIASTTPQITTTAATATTGTFPSTTIPSSVPLASSATAAAAVAASKLTSEIKSALPSITSLTKGKSDLFSSSFSKLGSFVSNAAAKTGVQVPLMPHKDVPKDKEVLQLQPQATPYVNPEEQQFQQDYYGDDQMGYDGQQWNEYGEWNGEYDENPEHYQDYGVQEGYTDAEPKDTVKVDEGPVKNGVTHMDSLESNVSEGALGAEDAEALYWQQQEKERQDRLTKQTILQAQDSQDYYTDPYDSSKPKILQSMDSMDEPGFDHDGFRQNSLDRDEWLKELEMQSGGQTRPSLSKKDTIMDSMDRSESMDQQDDYGEGDEYGTDQDGIRQESLESGEGAYPMSPPPGTIPEEDEIMENGMRKSSLDVQQPKGGKTVSFEEEPLKPVPERQTKGMSPREKWLWAINRICAQLAVSSLILIFCMFSKPLLPSFTIPRTLPCHAATSS